MTNTLPPSLYAQTSVPALPLPALQGSARTDVAIIGGGITGLSAALHLAERGMEVTLLEANEPGWGASGRNGGQVNPGLKSDPDKVEAAFGSELGRRMIEFSYGAPDYFFQLVERLGLDCEARQTGTLRLSFSPRTARPLAKLAAQCDRRGMPVELLTPPALARITGTGRYALGLRDARGGSVNPLSYARELARAAIAAGAKIHAGTKAETVTAAAGVWKIITPGGILLADKILLGTNAHTGDLWPGLRRSIVPVHSAVISSVKLPPDLAAQILPGREVAYEVGSVTVYYRVDQANRLLIGGRSTLRDAGGADAFPQLRLYAEKLWPALKTIEWSHGWNGLLAVTTDHYPHLHEPADGALVCLGYNGRGVAMATAMGGLLARRLCGTPAAELEMPFSPIRPIPLHRFRNLGVNARLAYGRCIDRLG